MDSKSPSPCSSIHKLNKTSSAGGDYHVVSRGSNKLPSVPVTKFKLQPLKSKKIKKKSKKMTRSNGSVKASFGSLRNAIVLAPFHSLKKCFQSKLVDFYAREKMQKAKHTIKKGNKKNLSFEYDVMEVNTMNTNIPKKDKKAPKKGQKKNNTPMEKKMKGSKTGQSSYFCNCKENKTKEDSKKFAPKRSYDMKRQKQARRYSTRSSTVLSSLKNSQVPSTSSEEVESKRRRLCDRVTYDSQDHPSSSGVLKLKKKGLQSPKSPSNMTKPRNSRSLISQNSNEYARSDRRSDTNWSMSGMSSRSQNDSWEEYSDSISASEGPAEAMSTASTNSRRIRSDKKVSNMTSSTDDSQTKIFDVKKKKKNDFVRDFPTTKSYNARHLVIGVDTSNSDEEIADFMDREPQSDMTADKVTTSLTPPRRKSKTKRQGNENVAASTYFLRSFNSSFGDQFQKLSDIERVAINLQDQAADIQKSLSEGNSNKRKSDVTVSEVHSEIENQGNVEKRVAPPNNVNNPTAVNQVMDVEVSNTISQTSSQPKASGLLFDSSQGSEITTNAVSEPSSDVQRVCLPGNIALAQTGTKESVSGAKEGREQNFTNKEIEKSESSVGLPQDVEKHRWFEGSSNNKQPQDKEAESNFIFGQGNASDDLRDSCELSFGLNWVLSDDEESNHKEKFF